jgi:hypothetical protein
MIRLTLKKNITRQQFFFTSLQVGAYDVIGSGYVAWQRHYLPRTYDFFPIAASRVNRSNIYRMRLHLWVQLNFGWRNDSSRQT